MIDNFFSKAGFYEIVSSLIAGIYEISIIAFFSILFFLRKDIFFICKEYYF